jgi:hypothetical protein
VVAERRLDDRADAPHRQREHHLVELLDHGAAAVPPEVAAVLPGARVLAVLLGQLGEVGALADLHEQRFGLGAGGGLGGRGGLGRDDDLLEAHHGGRCGSVARFCT